MKMVGGREEIDLTKQTLAFALSEVGELESSSDDLSAEEAEAINKIKSAKSYMTITTTLTKELVKSCEIVSAGINKRESISE